MNTKYRDCPNPRNPRAYSIPQERLDALRRRLDFSEESTEGTVPQVPVDKYGTFKKVSETHSTQEMEPPMYTSAEMAAVPDSFLEMFRGREPARAPVKRTSPLQSVEHASMPESFLEFCQGRLANQPARSPPKTPAYEPSYHAQSETPFNISYYGYEAPAAQYGSPFSPKHTSTPGRDSPRPVASACPAYSAAFPPSSYLTPARGYAPPGAVGLGKYCYASPTPYQTPPTPSWARGGSVAQDSSVSSGDFLASPSIRQSGPRRSRGTGMDNQGGLLMPPTPTGGVQTKSVMTNVRKLSVSSIPPGRRHSDPICADDLSQSRQNACPKCPTLRVTPVHSAVSFSSSTGAIIGSENKQNISQSIENELMLRETQEREQLEQDLLRWQRARRKLVMNTANMGA